MTTYLYSEITNGGNVPFDPEADVLVIDNATLSAADFQLTALDYGPFIDCSLGGKTFTLSGTTPTALNQLNVQFADGSLLVNSCSANGFAIDLSGSAHDDLLLGSPVNRPLDRISETDTGTRGNSSSAMPALSADGRYVVFESVSTNLVDGADTNLIYDIFLKDRLTGELTRVSTNANGDEAQRMPTQPDGADWGSENPALTPDGRYLVFESWAVNLVGSDTNKCADVFLKDLETGAVTRISEATAGTQANNTSMGASVSANGRYVAFTSYASNLVADDTNGALDVFVKDTQTGALTLVSAAADGEHGNAGKEDFGSHEATISADGRYVLFRSYATNLVEGDDNDTADIFVKDLQTGAVTCVSTDSQGGFVDGRARDATLSADGRYVVFRSDGALLQDGQDGMGAIYRRDLQTGELERVTGTSPDGGWWAGSASVSSDGRFVVFHTYEALVSGDTNNQYDVYVKDMLTGKVARVSVGEAGEQSGYDCHFGQISADGSKITFGGYSTLVGETGGAEQVFVVDNPLVGRTLRGGAGDDVYQITQAGDLIIEVPGQGTDTVRSSVSFTLPSAVEQLVLTGTAAINGTGNTQTNTIIGNAAANTIIGGAGADTMTGGAGNDTYVVDNSGDLIIEYDGGGIDLVQSSISFTLNLEVEKLTLTGTAATKGIGNALANTIVGNSAANVLNGLAGADSMTGGAGDDTYVVDNAGDKTVELANGGIDLVQSSVTHTLQTGVEKLTLTGSAAINGTGNTQTNTIIGNAAANVLTGGAGADTMTGGAGNDTYVVDNSGDQAVEAANGGIDLVQSSISFTLASEIEKLTLTGTAAISGTGNTAANTLVGNAAANVIDGKAGADTMTGGAGADIFAFTTALASDLITDFTSGSDKLRVSQAAIKVGDGDSAVEGAVAVTGPNGFASAAELVIITHNISGSLTASSAAAAIGHANSAYKVGDTRLFVVDNGIDSAVYLFKSADASATVTSSELTLLATLDNTHATVVTDYLFGA